MKKILFVTGFSPSEFSAGQNYTRHLLADIGSRYQIDLIYFRYDKQVYSPREPNIKVVRVIALSWLGKILNCVLCPIFHPFFSVRFSWRRLFLIRRLVRKNSYDILYFDFSQVFLYSFFLNHPRKMLMAHDVIYQKFARSGFGMKRGWIYWTEKIILNRNNSLVLTFSKKDQLLLKEKYNKESLIVSIYLSEKILALDEESLRLGDYFCFFAAWNRPENYEGLDWFIENVLPFTKNQKYIVVGAYLPRHIMKVIDGIEDIQYLGFIENPYELLAQAKALIAPVFKGAGVKVKVIESLACGTPAIGTQAALEGIISAERNGLRECNTADDFIREIVNFSFGREEKILLREASLKSYLAQRRTSIF